MKANTAELFLSRYKDEKINIGNRVIIQYSLTSKEHVSLLCQKQTVKSMLYLVF